MKTNFSWMGVLMKARIAPLRCALATLVATVALALPLAWCRAADAAVGSATAAVMMTCAFGAEIRTAEEPHSAATPLPAQPPSRNWQLILGDEGNKTLVLLDAKTGQIRWVLPTPMSNRSLQWLPTRRVLTSTGDGFWEIDPAAGKAVRRVGEFRGVSTAWRLPDSATALACGNQLLVVGADDKQAKTVALETGVHRRMTRSAKGTWLYGNRNRIVEADDNGREVWSMAVDRKADIYQAQHAADETIWAATGYGAHVIQVNRQKEVLRRFTGPQETKPHFYAGFVLLPDNHVLVTNWQGHGGGHGQSGVQLLEFDAEGHVVWYWRQDPEKVSSLHSVLLLPGE